MTDEQLEVLRAWMDRAEALLQQIADNIRRTEQNTSCIDGAPDDLTVKVGELFQAVDGIQADLMLQSTEQET